MDGSSTVTILVVLEWPSCPVEHLLKYRGNRVEEFPPLEKNDSSSLLGSYHAQGAPLKFCVSSNNHISRPLGDAIQWLLQ